MLYRPDIWFSPKIVLARYAKKEKELGKAIKKHPDYKQIREARSVAIMLLGMIKKQEVPYWIQMVNPKERTPDIRTMRLLERPGKSDWMEVQDVEVVTLNKFTDEAIDVFLKRTKLSIKKAYPAKTTVLCHIDRNIKTKPWREIHSSLERIKTKNDTFLLGRVDPERQIYQLARIHPSLDMLTTYDAVEEAIKFPGRDRRRFIKGSKKASFWEPENHEPF